MTTADIQNKILRQANLKTSVKQYKTGSLKGYYRIMPIFQNAGYPSIPFELVQELKNDLKQFDQSEKPLFCSPSDICVYGIQDERLNMKKESKPKKISELKEGKGWGSKNSQIRLDKSTKRYAKRLKKGGCARYY